MTTTTDTTATTTLDRERADLLETLGRHRWFLRFTVQGLTDEQAASRPTVSALTLSGLIHHVAEIEAQWVRFIEEGPDAFAAAIAMWTDPDADVDPEERWRIALTLLDRVRQDLSFGWVAGDDEFGRASAFRAELRWRRLRYLLDVPCNTLIRDLDRG